jgi:hypothetical protein
MSRLISTPDGRNGGIGFRESKRHRSWALHVHQSSQLNRRKENSPCPSCRQALRIQSSSFNISHRKASDGNDIRSATLTGYSKMPRSVPTYLSIPRQQDSHKDMPCYHLQGPSIRTPTHPCRAHTPRRLVTILLMHRINKHQISSIHAQVAPLQRIPSDPVPVPVHVRLP